MQCALCFCLIIYQISCKICVSTNHKTCSSCTVGHQILYSSLSTDSLWTAAGSGGPVDRIARSSGTITQDFWLLEYKNFGIFVFCADNCGQAVRQFEENQDFLKLFVYVSASACVCVCVCVCVCECVCAGQVML